MITSVKWVSDLQTLATENSAYRNKYPYNLLYWDGYRWWADCVNLLKALFNGRDITDRTVGGFQNNLTKTGDITELQMITQCTDVSSDFSTLGDKPEVLYMSGHIGTYLGKEVTIDGTVRNVIECTPVWENGIIYSYIDNEGNRYHHKGATQCNHWTLHGFPTKWVKYVNVEPETGFTDVPESLEPYVDWAVKNDIVKGYDDDTFRPDNPVTRGQFVTMIWRMMGRPSLDFVVNPFPDVTPDMSIYKPIMWAVSKDIVRGFADGYFKPNEPLTRSQAAIIMWRWGGRPDVTVLDFPFSDVIANSSYKNAVLWGSENGIIKGYSDGTFRPDEECLRSHAVIFLYRIAQKWW